MDSLIIATALNPFTAIVLNSLLIAGFSLLLSKFGAHPIVSVTFAALLTAVLAILAFAMERQFDPVHLTNWTMGIVVYSLGLPHVIDSSLSGVFDDLIFFWLSWAQPCLIMLGINYYRWGKHGERFRVTTRQ